MSFRTAASNAAVFGLAAFVVLAGAAAAADAPPPMIVPGQFNVSDSGAATYSIPIAVPPGTAGMVPALSLNYSSQGGDGLVGLGWTLSGLPVVTRCARTLAQDLVHGGVNYDSGDRFCLDGQRLMLVTPNVAYGAPESEYRTEIDNFSKIVAHGTAAGGSGPAWFEVRTKAGQVMEFGNTPDSRVLAVGTATARIWAVNRITDSAKNYLTVTYNCADPAPAPCGDRRDYGEVYPLRVDYTGHAAAPTLGPYNSVQFSYDPRVDSVPAYQAGSLQQTTVVLSHIKTYAGASLVTDYQLQYRAGTNLLHSRLIQIKQCDGSNNCFAPTTFTWQGGADTLHPAYSNPIGFGNQGDPKPNIAAGDYNGDGLTDAVQLFDHGGTPCPNAGSIYFATLSGLSYIFTSSNMTASYTAPEHPDYNCNGPADFYSAQMPAAIDTNGDGYADTLVADHSVGSHKFYALQNDRSLHLPQLGPAILYVTLTGDFDGDGRSDLFSQDASDHNSHTYLSNGDGTFAAGRTYTGDYNAETYVGDFDGDGCTDVLLQNDHNDLLYSCNPAIPSYTPPDWSGYRQTVLGDFNGDGKTDLLITPNQGTGAMIYLATGKGFAAPLAAPALEWRLYLTLVGDWNADGRQDIALIGTGSAAPHLFFLSTGTGFVQVATLSNDAGNADIYGTVADWDNDGAPEIWLQKQATAPRDNRVGFYGPLFPQQPYVPELMTGVSNGIGAAIGIGYDRLNRNGTFYVRGSSPAYPTQNLDGAIYVVASVAASNGVGTSYISYYAYGGAQADLRGRGFLGFASMTVTDNQTGIVQTTTYNTLFPLTGSVATLTKKLGATTLNATTNTYDDQPLGNGRHFVALHQSVVASNDLNGAAMPAVTTTYTYDCDSSTTCYGNATQVSVSTALNGTVSSTSDTTNVFSNDTTNWILGRLTSSSVDSFVTGQAHLVRHSSFDYDSTTGLLKQEIVEPQDCEYKLQTDYTLDAFGNRTATAVSGAGCSSDNYRTGIAPRTSHAGYDPAGVFEISAANALSQSESWSYNAAFGEAVSHTGPNGLTTAWTFDTLGRPVKEIRPDGTRTMISYAYCSGVNNGTASCPSNGAYLKQTAAFAADGTTAIGPVSTIYYDVLSRPIVQDVQGFDGCLIRSATVYDAKGRVFTTRRPYFTATPGICSTGTAQLTTNTYDALGRVTRTDFPNGGHTTFAYDGLTTSATNDLGQTTTTTRNAQGLSASVTDAANNTTAYVYDSLGHLLTITDPSGNVIGNAYDIRGNKTESVDPDLGHWNYLSDVLGELKSQTDAKGQTTSLDYDLLGRVVRRFDGVVYSNWLYGTAAPAVGKLVKSCTTAGDNPGCAAAAITSKSFGYDALGRPATTAIAVDGASYLYTTTYNATNGAVDAVFYPSGFAVRDVYNSRGYLCRLTDTAGTPSCASAGGAIVLWTAVTRDAELHLTSQTEGNGVTTGQSFDAATGLLTAVTAGPSNTLAAFSYTYDHLGNLTARSDANAAVYERYCYDGLNRLTVSATGPSAGSVTACTSAGTGIVNKTVAYDPLGNITYKSDVCGVASCYGYGTGGIRPHAVASVAAPSSGVSGFYAYDANGNLTCASSGASCSGTVNAAATYTAFDRTASLVQGGTALCFAYDADHARIRMENRSGDCTGTLAATTTYLNDPASGAMSEKIVVPGNVSWRDYLTVDGHIVAQRSSTAASGPVWGAFTWGAATWTAPVVTWSWFVLDSLGSVAIIADNGGALVQRLSYDAWGRSRNANGTDAACGANPSSTTRGFTGQEMLAGGCLINLNARLYDPTLGRFLAADPTIESPFDLQDLNRYSYVGNNPLSFTDPSGLCFLGCFYKDPVFRAIAGIALSALLQQHWALPALLGTGVVGSTLSAGISGAAGGYVSTGTLKGALISSGEAFAFAGIHFLKQATGLATSSGAPTSAGAMLASAGAHGLVGGLASVAGGGSFGSGFLAAGFSDLAGPDVPSDHASVGAVVEHAVTGGIGSVLGGGKFENGAITGAFGYLFNSALDPNVNPPSACEHMTGAPCVDFSQYNTGDCTVWEGCGRPPPEAKLPGDVDISIGDGLAFAFESNRDGSGFLGFGGGFGAKLKGMKFRIEVPARWHPVLDGAISWEGFNAGLGNEPYGTTIKLDVGGGYFVGGNLTGYFNFSGISLHVGPAAQYGAGGSVTLGYRWKPETH